MKLDVCVVTYRRPEGLQRLLGGLQQQRLPDPAPDLRVVVVDNDALESARPVCDAAAGWLGHALLYEVEKRRGIPQARNRALALALGHADWVAFVDDDEVPEFDWLAELLRVAESRGADAVAGRVEPVFPQSPRGWIERSRLFERARHVTGTGIGYACTHNVLVSSAALSGLDALFDERLALCGGSDTELFERLASSGRRIVWADSALVREWIPPERARLVWLLRRALRTGASRSFIDRRCRHPRAGALRILAHAAWCLGAGVAAALWGLLGGRETSVRGLRLAAYGAGRAAGFFGWRLEEYRAPTGA